MVLLSLLFYVKSNQRQYLLGILMSYTVSSVPDKTGKNKSKINISKEKLLETDDQKETRLAKRRNAYRRKAYETDDKKTDRTCQKKKSLRKNEVFRNR